MVTQKVREKRGKKEEVVSCVEGSREASEVRWIWQLPNGELC